MLLIKNADILTMTEQGRIHGDVLIKDGKIVEVGSDIKASDAEVFDAEGKVLMPGIIDAHCHIGMWEDGIDTEGADGNEATDPLTPALRAIDAINPFDRCFKEALEGGVTTVVTGPGSANIIGGQFVAMKTYGADMDDMIIKAPAALKAALGENPKTVYGEQKKAPMTRMASAAILRKALVDAQEYIKECEGEKPPKRDLGMEAIAAVLKGELIMKVHAHRADDIATAVRIADEFGINISLDHCTEGYMIPAFLKRAGVPVIIGPLLCDRCKPELKNLSLDSARILWENGIEFALMSDHPVILTQYLPMEAAMLVRKGLPKEIALRAITINAAKAVGIDDRVGSIEPGKDADMVLFNGDPLDIVSGVSAVFASGEKVC